MSYFRKTSMNGMGDEEGNAFASISAFLDRLQQNLTGPPGGEPLQPNTIVTPIDDGPGTPSGSSGNATISGIGFKVIGGVCKPTSEPTLRIVQGVQDQVNRIAQAKGFAKIQRDGDIGTLTLSAIRSAKAASGGRVTIDTTNCSTVGGQIQQAFVELRAFADAIGAPSSATPPKLTSQPSIATPLGLKPVAASAGLLDAVRGMPLPMKLAFGGIMAGIGYFVFLDKPRGKGRK